MTWFDTVLLLLFIGVGVAYICMLVFVKCDCCGVRMIHCRYEGSGIDG
jgi:hypothetical protein